MYENPVYRPLVNGVLSSMWAISHIRVSKVMQNAMAVVLGRNNRIEAACKPFIGIAGL
jgi:hypothetical protein